MKTIEQAAEEYANKVYPKMGLNDDYADDGFDEGYNAAKNKLSIADFKAGVEFAQQWYSVNDELPAVGETVLLKFENNEEHVTTGIYIKSFHGDCAYQESGEQCTHWRQINLK